MPVSLDELRELAPRLLRADRFATRIGLAYVAGPVVVPWELFQGRLVERTRERRSFETWAVHQVEGNSMSPEPLLALLAGEGVVHIVRGVEGFAWEGHDSDEGIDSRCVRRWLRELIASFSLAMMRDAAQCEEELTAALQRAVWGARLPLLPTEAPHPLFSFGRLAYAVAEATPSRRVETWLRMLSPSPQALADAWGDRDELYCALRGVFDDVSLSPWTDLIPRLLDAVSILFSPAETADFLASVMLLVTRHLTAYDLVTFHHRGANFPDALLIDELLSRLISLAEREPELFDTPRRRLALRQGYVTRLEYEGHTVPDVPTSPGEVMRVYPETHPHPPDEQLTEPRTRRRILFGAQLHLSEQVRALLVRSTRESLDELGSAVYLDRPFGDGKATVEPDSTPLVASLAYSRIVATRRARVLSSALGLEPIEVDEVRGLSLSDISPATRLGTISLLDAARIAPDFVYRRTLPGSRRLLASRLPMADVVLVARTAEGVGLYDADFALKRTLRIDYSAGYRSERGIEWPASLE